MDITTLGIGVDSRPVDQATKSMDQMTGAAQRVEQATQRMGRTASEGSREAAREMKELEKAMASAATQGVVIGEAISKGISMAVEAVKKLDDMINKVGDLQDIADMTGASASGLSKMRVAADVAGVSMDKLGQMIMQMTRQISASSDESKGAGKALGELGINIDRFRQMRGDEQIMTLARALSKVEDSGGKSALMLDIAGRGAGDFIKLLKALGEEANRTAGHTDEVVAAMDDYSDANKRAHSQMNILMEGLAIEMAPAFAAFRLALRDTIAELMGVGKESSDLAKNKGALDFAYAVGRGLANVVDLAIAAGAQLVAFGKSIGVVAAVAGALIRGEGIEGAGKVIDEFKADIESLKRAANAFDMSDSFDKRFNQIIRGEKEVTGEIDKELSARIAAHKRANDRMTAEERAAQRAALQAMREAERERKKEIEFRVKWGRQQAIAEGDAVNKAAEEAEKKREAARKAQLEQDDKAIENSQHEINMITARAIALEDEVANRGKLRSAIEEEKLARMEADRAAVEGDELASIQLEKRIDAQKRLIQALRGEEVAIASEKASKKAAEDWDRTWQQVGQSLSDELMKGGQTAAQMLKNLFRTLVLKPVIEAGVMGLLGGTTAGATAAGSNPLGGVAGNLLGAAGSIFGAGGLSGALSAGAGWLTGATTFGGAMSAGASLIGTGTMSGVASGLGMMAGALGPVAIGVYGLAKLFGGKRGGPQVGGAVGVTGAGVAPEDRSMNATLKANLDAANDTFAKLMSQLGAMNPGITFGQSASSDPQGTSLSSAHTQVFRNGQLINEQSAWQTVGRNPEDLEKALQNQLANAMITALHQSNIDGEILAYFDSISAGLDGAAKLSALQTLPALAELKRAFQGLSYVFPQLSSLSLEAKMAMANMAGGIDQLTGLMNGFMQNFFTAGERLSIAGGQLNQQLGALGYSVDITTMSMGDFRNMVMGINTATKEGQAAFVTALQASAAFAEFKREQEAEAERARQEWERQQAEIEAENARRQAEYEQRLAEATSNLENAYRTQADEIERNIDSLERWKESLEDLRNNLLTDQSFSPLTPQQRYNQAATRFAEISALAESGDERAQQLFEGAARDFLNLSRQQYASGEQYMRDFDLVSKTIRQLETAAKNQLTDAQKQLEALNQTVGALIEINRNVMSVDQAIREFLAVKAAPVAPYVAPAYVPPPTTTFTPASYTPPASTGMGGGAFGGSVAPAPYTGGVVAGPTMSNTPGPNSLGMGIEYYGDYMELPGFAMGLSRVPHDNFAARLHKDEAVLTPQEAPVWRNSPAIAEEVRKLGAEMRLLRRENRQDAGRTIGATLQAAQQSAQVQSEAVIRAARQRTYQSKPRTTLT